MKKKTVLAIVLTICIALFGGGYIYFTDCYHADTKAKAALVSDEAVQVKDSDAYIAFEPASYDTGIILYPGAKVESEAYAPLCRKYAENGVLAVVVKMPLHFALFNQNAADSVLDDYKCEHWYMAGHSLGGVCAGNYIAEHVKQFDGLIMLASYTTKDLSETSLKYISLYGSDDKVLNLESYDKNVKNVPEETSCEFVIHGGNHAQFGSYGEQKGDGTAVITAADQQEQTVQETMKILD